MAGDFIEIAILAFIGYLNSVRARQKGQNGFLWAFITIIAYYVAQAIGMYIVISWFCQDTVDLSVFSNSHINFQAVSKQFNQQVQTAFAENPLRLLTVFMFGIGGYLFVRYLIDRKPGKKGPEIHWMDRLGGNE